MATDPNLQNIENAAEQVQSELNADAAQIATDQQAISADQAALDAAQAANSQLLTQVSQLQAQLADIQAIKTFDGLELTPWLVAAGTAANSAGGTSTAASKQGQPGVESAFFEIDPAASYADKYFFKQLGAIPGITKIQFEASFLFPTDADAANSQAIEMDTRNDSGNVVENAACQMDFAEGLLRIWNRSAPTNRWVSIGIPCPRWSSGVWVPVVLKAHKDATTLYYDSLQVGADAHDLSAFSFPLTNEQQTDKLNCAIQLDGDKASLGYRVCIDRVRLTVS